MTLELHDPRTAGVGPCQAEGDVSGLGSRNVEPDPLGARNQLDEPLCELHVRPVRAGEGLAVVEGVPYGVEYCCGGEAQERRSVAEHVVDVAVLVGVPHVRPFAPVDGEGAGREW